MSNSGGFAVTRTQTGDRFYNPPAVRRQQQQLQRQQQHRPLQKELQRPLKEESRVNSVDSLVESRTDSDESTLSRPELACSSVLSSPEIACLTNLDRLMESVTPLVTAQCFSEAKMRGWRTHEVNVRPYFCLGDLWECFSEWSVYGVGVPLLLNGSDSVKQYYVPSLSGIQLYVDPIPNRLRRVSEDSDVSSRVAIIAGSSDCETDRRGKDGVDGAWGKHNSQGISKPPMCSSSDEMEVGKSPGLLVFEYFEQEQPRHRKPLYEKISGLASQFPEIRKYMSCDLLPASWISVAWYPIYRIPMGPTLQNLDASFLTFHSLSTCSQTVTGKNQLYFPASSRKICGVDASSKLSLPVFGLASYKLRGSILTPNCSQEKQQANSLLQAANNWLHALQVRLPDFQFFASHNSKW